MKLRIIAVLLIAFALVSAFAAANEDKKIELVVFHGQGCSHCVALRTFLDSIQPKYPEMNVIEYEVYFSQTNRELWQKYADAFGTTIQGVPMIFIDGKNIVGFNDKIGTEIEQEIQRCTKEECPSPVDKLKEGGSSVSIIGESSPKDDPATTEALKKVTIPAVITAAAVDAINPCEFAILIILLTTILAAGIRKRVLYAGLAFSLSIFISYYLMGLGLYSAIQATGISKTFYVIMAVVAIIIGLFNLKDYLWYGKWFIMEVPLSWRPRMKTLLKGITSVPGAFLIGFVLSLFLLPCTSGPYIVILGLLAQTTTRNHAMVLLLLYNFIFILPMIGITLAIYFGFTTTEKAEEWRQTKLKMLHLIAGVILILLGIGMFIAMKLGMI
ncbi:MAG: cytochrome c biogenesis protein CcdA [Nanoarchaeota archaeon]|nr:cytochrome c biogenesis protein CcdA [Nanoarchaeota archaeon]